ncbi:tRNA (guanosine(37)-N1)-methyltransferase TrmD [Chromatiales bacterium (ex Bugula neritina AB1)]|nr:tRNA (guanosine(37)-N1)-methyltransferase TrmD [Chromatiales bacterium (ex Bugula neritina AB1)]
MNAAVNIAVSVVTLFPDLVGAVVAAGVTGRAVDNGLLQLSCVNPRDHATDQHRRVDDRPYGGGPGMVMQPQPLSAAIAAAKTENGKYTKASPVVIYLSPQGEKLDHKLVLELAGYENLVLLAGRYEGVDERVIELLVDREISIGDYVLSGGELASMVVVDALARQIPGVLGHDDSAAQDSFAGQGLLDCPHYTRPEHYGNKSVPAVLASGDHKAIARWRRQQSLGRTWQRRPELLDNIELSKDDKRLLQQYMDAQNTGDPADS